MSRESQDLVPVLSTAREPELIGVLAYKDILAAYTHRNRNDNQEGTNLSLKRQSLKIVIRGRAFARRSRKVKDT